MEELLRQLNLTQYEIKAYLALLKVEAVTAYQLGSLSSIPSGRIYDVVESLVSKGIVSILPGTPRLVKAINPKIGLKALLDKKDREWKKESGQLKHLINKLEKKEEENREDAPYRAILVNPGRTTICGLNYGLTDRTPGF